MRSESVFFITNTIIAMEFISSFAARYGRIARGTWVFRIVILAMMCAAFGLLAQAVIGSTGAALFAALFLWCASAVSIQRLHDTGHTGWSLFVLLIPVLGPIWLAVQLARRGVEGPNRFGPDPVARMDYLRVDITK
jgi:uncharacterized membrane protein YhaH (DUF805 family)